MPVTVKERWKQPDWAQRTCYKSALLTERVASPNDLGSLKKGQVDQAARTSVSLECRLNAVVNSPALFVCSMQVARASFWVAGFSFRKC
jgi:hypothetical protein